MNQYNRTVQLGIAAPPPQVLEASIVRQGREQRACNEHATSMQRRGNDAPAQALAPVNRKTFALLTGDAGILARARAMGVAGFPKPEGVDAVIRYALGDQGRKRSSGKPRKS